MACKLSEKHKIQLEKKKKAKKFGKLNHFLCKSNVYGLNIENNVIQQLIV